jgi:hypothetical protein
MMRLLTVLILSIAFCVTASAATVAAAPRSHIPQIRQLFSYYLKDPSSLQIEVQANKPDAICGRYNAKNSYGGYVGFKFFSFVPSTETLYLIGTTISKSGQVQDAVAMAENLPLDPDKFAKAEAQARAVFDVSSNKIRDCGNA